MGLRQSLCSRFVAESKYLCKALRCLGNLTEALLIMFSRPSQSWAERYWQKTNMEVYSIIRCVAAVLRGDTVSQCLAMLFANSEIT